MLVTPFISSLVHLSASENQTLENDKLDALNNLANTYVNV